MARSEKWALCLSAMSICLAVFVYIEGKISEAKQTEKAELIELYETSLSLKTPLGAPIGSCARYKLLLNKYIELEKALRISLDSYCSFFASIDGSSKIWLNSNPEYRNMSKTYSDIATTALNKVLSQVTQKIDNLEMLHIPSGYEPLINSILIKKGA